MARIEEALSAVGAQRTGPSKVRDLVAAGVIAVVTLASAGAATGTSISRATGVRTDTDSVATVGDQRDTTRATVVCSARDAIRLGCLPGLRRWLGPALECKDLEQITDQIPLKCS